MVSQGGECTTPNGENHRSLARVEKVQLQLIIMALQPSTKIPQLMKYVHIEIFSRHQ